MPPLLKVAAGSRAGKVPVLQHRSLLPGEQPSAACPGIRSWVPSTLSRWEPPLLPGEAVLGLASGSQPPCPSGTGMPPAGCTPLLMFQGNGLVLQNRVYLLTLVPSGPLRTLARLASSVVAVAWQCHAAALVPGEAPTPACWGALATGARLDGPSGACVLTLLEQMGFPQRICRRPATLLSHQDPGGK